MEWGKFLEIEQFERNEIPEEPYPIVVEIVQEVGPQILR